jgi:predicted dehydrogenase
MATTLEDANKMIEVCRKKNVKLGCIFQRRVVEPFVSVKKALENDELGKLVLADCQMKYYRSQAYYDSAGWRGTWQYDGGGALMNQGIHMIDMLLWLVGPVKTVYSYTRTLARRIEVEDTAVAVLEFKNGAIGMIEGATSIFPADIPHRLELHGVKGSILIEGEGIKRWVTGGPDGEPIEKEIQKEGVGQAIPSPTAISDVGHKILI